MFFRKLKDQKLVSFNAKEDRLARSYIKAVAKDCGNFIFSINCKDEMYLVTKNNAEKKETTLYAYFKSGKEAVQTIENIIFQSGKSFRKLRSFLDFACGYGRSTRFLIQEIEPEKIWVSDIYKDAVDFQKNIFKVNGFYSKYKPSKLKFPKEFELIYAGSLFSHLPADRFAELLLTLYNALSSDGVLIFSTHGPTAIPPEVQSNPSGFTFLRSSESKSLSVKEYGSAFVTSDWVKNLANKLTGKDIYLIEKELCDFQDIYVITKGSFPGLQSLRPNNYPKGNIDNIQISPSGSLSVRGWGIQGLNGAPVQEVCIYSDDLFVGHAALGFARPDVADYFRRPDCLNSGWEFRSSRPVFDKPFSEEYLKSIPIRVVIKNREGYETNLCSFA